MYPKLIVNNTIQDTSNDDSQKIKDALSNFAKALDEFSKKINGIVNQM